MKDFFTTTIWYIYFWKIFMLNTIWNKYIFFLNCRPHQIFDHDGFTSSLDAWHLLQKWKRGSISWNNPTQSLHQSLPNWRYPLQYQVCERVNNWMWYLKGIARTSYKIQSEKKCSSFKSEPIEQLQPDLLSESGFVWQKLQSLFFNFWTDINDEEFLAAVFWTWEPPLQSALVRTM